MKTTYKISGGKSERRSAAGKLRHRFEGNMKMYVQVYYRLDISGSEYSLTFNL